MFERASGGQGRAISVPAGGDFQSALEQAQPGDTIVLASGATYKGNFILPNKSGQEYITIRTSAMDRLPPEGSRVHPRDAVNMPKLVSPDTAPVVAAAERAHHFRFVGIEFHPSPRVYMYGVIQLGLGTETSAADLPHDFVFDRCYIHGDPDAGARRGIYISGGGVTVENCYLADFKGIGEDTEALSGSNTPGPLNIINNYLEASGENIIFGGGGTFVPDMVPSDIVIRHNYFYKPLAWRKGDPHFAGTLWTVKNLLEFKRARRVLVEGNLFENCWAQAQAGYAIAFTVRTDQGHTPWSVVEDVNFTHNIVRHAAAGFTITGHDDNGMGQEKNIVIKDNLLDDISGSIWGGQDKMFQLLFGTDGVTIDHNTVIGDAIATTMIGGQVSHTNFIFRNNVVPFGKWGIATSKGEGLVGLNVIAPGCVLTRNALVRDPDSRAFEEKYPPGNFILNSWKDVGFVDLEKGDYHLSPGSRYRGAGTDGKDLGADMDAIARATANVESGR